MRTSFCLLFGAAVLFFAGCSHTSDSASISSASETSPTTSAPPDASASSIPSAQPDASTPPATETSAPPDAVTSPTPPATLLLRNSKSAIDITRNPDNTAASDIYIAERHGLVWQVSLDSSEEKIVLDISNETTAMSELGLLGLTISPDGKWLYISYSSTTAQRESGESPPNVVEAIRISDLNSENPRIVPRVPIITIPQPASNHNGGDILFSPQDGYLYIGLGDGGRANDVFENGQNTFSLLGSILRIDPKPETGGYNIPPDNPFADGLQGAAEIWAYGIRNAWRISFHPVTGDLWFGDVGQNEIEEINQMPAGMGGLNLGWNVYEGTKSFRGGGESINHHSPIFEYPHEPIAPSNERACSITGGFIYSGNLFPDLQGKYLYADFCVNGMVRAFDGQTDILVAHQPSVGGIINFGETPDGEVLVASFSGTFQLTPDISQNIK